jgi:hypothetical protein
MAYNFSFLHIKLNDRKFCDFAALREITFLSSYLLIFLSSALPFPAINHWAIVICPAGTNPIQTTPLIPAYCLLLTVLLPTATLKHSNTQTLKHLNTRNPKSRNPQSAIRIPHSAFRNSLSFLSS